MGAADRGDSVRFGRRVGSGERPAPRRGAASRPAHASGRRRHSEGTVLSTAAAHRVLLRHHVRVLGPEHGAAPHARPIVLGHGFGMDQQAWRAIAPTLARERRVVLFDHVGFGHADPTAYHPTRHGQLQGYADDLLELMQALALPPVLYVGHSAGGMIGLQAAATQPSRFGSLCLIGASARFLDDPPDYVGGLQPTALEALLDGMERDQLAWAASLAPLALGAAAPGALTDEFARSLGALDPLIGRRFARMVFSADLRGLLPRVDLPCLLVHSRDDPLVPRSAAQALQAGLPQAELHLLDAQGHCPHLTHPAQVLSVLQRWAQRDGH